MRRLAIVAAVLVLAGCSDSHDSSVAESASAEVTEYRIAGRRDAEPPRGGAYPPADVVAGNPLRERARSSAAPTNSRKSGAGRVGRDLNSGWNWLATNHG